MTNLYVSPTGSDSNSGSQSAPLLTIQAASQLAQPGTTVYVAPGTYQGGFETSTSGTASAPITYVSEVAYGAQIVGGPLSNANDAGWWNSGNYVDIKGFDIDGSNTQAAAWRIGYYGSGSYDTFQGNEVHAILVNQTAYTAAQSSGDGGAGIDVDGYYGGANSSTIGNLVYNIGPAGLQSFEVQGIYVTQSGTIDNNVVSNVVGTGIQLWHGAQNINIVNNTIDGARDFGICVGSGDSGATATTGDHINVENNIISNSAKGVEECGTTGVHNTYVDNLLYNVPGTNMSLQNGLKAVGTINANPDYVNPGTLNYQLQAGSPAIGAGTSNLAPATDFAGTARPQGGDTVGAYQYTSSVVTPDTLSLALSEDAYLGNAQFIAKMDGTQIAGPTAVTTLRSSGNSELFTYTGTWGPGQHNLEIDFINDKYAGTPSTDRNLYVNQVTFDGTNYLTHTDPLLGNGAIHITIGH
jgi:hypothetical protein